MSVRRGSGEEHTFCFIALAQMCTIFPVGLINTRDGAPAFTVNTHLFTPEEGCFWMWHPVLSLTLKVQTCSKLD